MKMKADLDRTRATATVLIQKTRPKISYLVNEIIYHSEAPLKVSPLSMPTRLPSLLAAGRSSKNNARMIIDFILCISE